MPLKRSQKCGCQKVGCAPFTGTVWHSVFDAISEWCQDPFIMFYPSIFSLHIIARRLFDDFVQRIGSRAVDAWIQRTGANNISEKWLDHEFQRHLYRRRIRKTMDSDREWIHGGCTMRSGMGHHTEDVQYMF